MAGIVAKPDGAKQTLPAMLDDSGKLPAQELGDGMPTGVKFLRDDNTWQEPPGGAVGDFDGGAPDSDYGGIDNIDAGGP
jgi:hypothetical protein